MSFTSSVREDYLASFCFAAEGDVEQEIETLSRFAGDLEKTFRYWEIVYVLGERNRARAEHLIPTLPNFRNLRIIVVRDSTNFYSRRVVAVSEAIGDVVVLSSFAEIDFVDATALAQQTYQTEQIVLARHKRRMPSLLHWLLMLISSYRINDSDLKTIALPRTRLNALLSRPTLTLDLRFEPKHGGEAYIRKLVDIAPRKRRRSEISDRYELLEALISASAARVLRAYAACSTLVAFLALIYAIYAIVIVLIKPDVQEGWFSTAIVQSGSVGFIALGMTVISIGIADVVERLSGGAGYVIVDEVANVSLFESANDKNVEVAIGREAEPTRAGR